jgi:hypothetical protein
LLSSDDVIDTFFKWKPPIFFIDSDNPYNCLNDSIKILLSYIRKFLRKKNNKVGKNKFYMEQKQVNKSSRLIEQSNVTVNFIRMCYLFYKTFSKMTHLTETQRIEILILIGCWNKTKTGGIPS